MAKKTKMLTVEEEQLYTRSWRDQQDIASRDKVILAYRPLALKIAKGLAKSSGMSMEDLAQESFLALTDSINKFDPDRGVLFGTFAGWHIMGQLRRYIMDFRNQFRTGTNIQDKKVFAQFNKYRSEYESLNNKILDEDGRNYIAEKIGVPRHIIDRVEPRLSNSDQSLNVSISGEDGDSSTYNDLLIDTRPNPEEETSENFDNRKAMTMIKNILNGFGPREQMIITERFLKREQTNLETISKQLGLTKERIRQIERDCLEKLRKNMVSLGYRKEDLIPH